ncbi:hypothetical protein [Sinorhizobium meliloti]|uniref:hypothetical protein n=1 Tax=Rhizobium meliloti TaxID=382 RepID=UPI000FDC878B|nr:hypothetical protein [Sinorhizobium meliloti]RVQ07341.1 hypothetical protein CN069_02310 [Sinorhizobium meliloti]
MKTLIAAAAMAALSFCGIANAQEYSLRFSTSQVNPNEPIIKAMKTYAERVGERSGGRIAITVMTGDQLGAQKKVNEMVMSGASLTLETDDAYAKQLAASGVEIVTDVDIPSFIEASRAAYEKVPNITPGIYDQVQKAMAE